MLLKINRRKIKMRKIFLLFIVINSCSIADMVPQNLSYSQVDARLDKTNGDTAEYVMNKLFKKNGWRQTHQPKN